MIKEEALQRFPDKPTFRDIKRSNIVRHQEELLRKELRIIGTHQGLYPRTPFHHFQWTRGANRQFIFDALSREDFHVAHLISHRVPYQQAADMYAMIARGPEGWQSIILEWDGS